MPEMRVAGAAHYFGTANAMTAIRFRLDGGLSHGRVETGPAGSGIIFGLGTEQFLAAAGAAVNAAILAVVVLAGKGLFRALRAADPEFFRGEFLAPLRFSFGYEFIGQIDLQ